MGLLDMIQNDPQKREALRQGLLAAGVQMLAGGRQDFGSALGQGLGAGASVYNYQQDLYRQEAEKAKQRQAQQQAIQAAMVPGRPAIQPRAAVPAQTVYKPKPAQEPLMPVMNGQNTPLLSYMDYAPDMMPEQQAEIPAVQGQSEQPGGFDADRYYMAAMMNPDNPERDAALKYFASKKPAELDTVVVGRTLKNKRTGETIGIDETWKEEQDAQRKQRMEEINLRLADNRASREERMSLQREQMDLRSDMAAQSAADRRDALQLRADDLTAKRDAKQETQNLTKQSQIASFDTMLGTLDRLGKHPGLARSVGVIGVLPTIPGSDSANFQAELNTFQSQAFVPMVAQLKGMGALSDAEGKKLTAAVGALDPRMGEKAFRESVGRITREMEAARSRVAGKQQSAPAIKPTQRVRKFNPATGRIE